MLKIKVIKSTLPTYWYHDQIGKILYALDEPNKDGDYIQCTEYGIEIRALFDKQDIEIIK